MRILYFVFVGSLFGVAVGCNSGPDSDISLLEAGNETVSKPAIDSLKFTVSPSAVKVLKSVTDSERMKYVRATCLVGGCSGFSYDLKTTNDFDESADHLFVFNGVKIVIDKGSFELMSGASLDYVTTTETAGFVFKNPKSTKKPSSE